MIKVASIFIIVATIFGIYELVSFVKNKVSKGKAPTTMLVKDIVGQDSNHNGIADWEESLWGLDPSKNGDTNKEFIVAKRATLAQNNTSLIPATAGAQESDALSKEFFSVVMSLMQSGNLNNDAVAKISDAIGQKIVPDQLPDVYTKNMLIINNKTDSDMAYFQAFDKLSTKYKDADMGGELTIIAQGLANNDPQALRIAANMADSYKSFADELIKIPVPENLAVGDLNLANDYQKIGKSLEGFTEILDNPLSGMKALINYKKYSDSVTSDLASISSNL